MSTPNNSPQRRPAGAVVIDRQVTANPDNSERRWMVLAIRHWTGWWGSNPGIPTSTEPHDLGLRPYFAS
jgi:hypothetical protein